VSRASGGCPLGGEREIALCTPAALQSRLTESRGDEPFGFEPLEDRIDASLQHFAPGSLRNLGRYRHSVRLPPEAHHRQQHHELVLAEKFTVTHFINGNE